MFRCRNKLITWKISVIFLFHFTTFHAYVRLDMIGTLFLPIVLVFYCHCNKLLQKQRKFITLQLCEWVVRTQFSLGVAGLYFLLEALGENPFPCLFQLLEASHLNWLIAPLPPLSKSIISFFSAPCSVITSLCVFSWERIFKDSFN